MKQTLLIVFGLLTLMLVGCSGQTGSASLETMSQAEDDLKAAALPLAEEAERLFSDLVPARLAPQAESPRSLTLIQDSDGITLVASHSLWQPPEDPSVLGDRPLAVVIRCTSDGRRCAGYRGNLGGTEQEGYRITWYGGKDEGGRRLSRSVPAGLGWGGLCPPGQPHFSWKKWGMYYVFDGCQYFNPNRIAHLNAPFPSDLPGQDLSGTLDTTPFAERLRQVCCGLPKPFDVEWPPAILLREDVAVAFLPYQNPRLRQARSLEELVGEPLGIAYWRQAAGGATLTKADAARILEVKFTREDPDWILVATDLKDPSQTLKFRVGEVGWCDGCFGQDPPPGQPIPRYLGIEDRLQEPPMLHLQVGPLELRGIEKKDIRR
ncbi:hypothetical protein Mlute_02769 [Meiothermus luteus]|uniref:Uncharacterized protein n=1 Tax=Meiothermus luteus TaxID=2026184 RepID=A0A399EA33_9DEIN|nr:hypothetical protein [Meiothermus luteus]RIH81554.1 hypothetical protein Mlute_02769 [Meiothermus luteus]